MGNSEQFASKALEVVLLKKGWAPYDLLYESKLAADKMPIYIDLVLLIGMYPVAVVEFVNQDKALADGAQQVVAIAKSLEVNVAFVVSSDGFIQIRIDGIQVEYTQVPLSEFPSPQELWSFLKGEPISHNDPRTYPPCTEFIKNKYAIYQAQAVSKTVEALLGSKKKLVLSMVAGSGKTIVVLQVIWKLLKTNTFNKVLCVFGKKVLLDQLRSQITIGFGNYIDNSQLMQSSNANGIQLALVNHVQTQITADREFAREYDLIILFNDINTSHLIELTSSFKEISRTLTITDDWDAKQLYELGEVTFSYSFAQYAQLEEDQQVSAGYTKAILRSIADLKVGFSLTNWANMLSETESKLPVITSAAIQSDGTLDSSKFKFINASADKAGLELLSDYALKPGDILIAHTNSFLGPRIAILEDYFEGTVLFGASIIRIRSSEKIAPQSIYEYLQSPRGHRALLQLTKGTGPRRLSLNDLANIVIWIPESVTVESKAKQSTLASDIRNQITGEIFPKLDQLHTQILQQQVMNLEISQWVGSRLEELASILLPQTLESRITETYPTPIALAYRRFMAARFNVYEQALRLRDLFESACFFVYNTFLADALRRLDPADYYVADRGARRAYNGASMAAKLDFIKSILQSSSKPNIDKPFLPKLDMEFVNLAQKLQNEFRNKLSHNATSTESQQKNTVEQFKPLVENLLQYLDFLSDYNLVRVTGFYFSGNSLVRRMEVYKGLIPDIDESVLQDRNIPDLTRADHNHLVLLDADDQILDLHPIYQLISAEATRYETHICYLKARKQQDQSLDGESIHGAFSLQLWV